MSVDWPLVERVTRYLSAVELHRLGEIRGDEHALHWNDLRELRDLASRVIHPSDETLERACRANDGRINRAGIAALLEEDA